MDHDPIGLRIYTATAAATRPKLILYREVSVLRTFNAWLRKNYVRCTNQQLTRDLAFDPDRTNQVEMWVRSDVGRRSSLCRPASGSP